MFRPFRHLSEVLQGCKTALEFLGDGVARHNRLQEGEDGEGLMQRIVVLEVARATWESDWLAARVLFEAQIEAGIQKAKSHYDGARNAEERARTMKKAANAQTDDGDSTGEADIIAAYAEMGFVPRGNGEGGEEEELSAVHELLAVPGSKQAALIAKFRLQGGQ